MDDDEKRKLLCDAFGAVVHEEHDSYTSSVHATITWADGTRSFVDASDVVGELMAVIACDEDALVAAASVIRARRRGAQGAGSRSHAG